MIEIETWLRSRDPAAPDDLRRRVGEAVTGALRPGSRGEDPGAASAEERVDRLARAAVQHLRIAVARTGRIRATAFELLVADALVTYACEAAMETECPTEMLEEIMEVVRTR